MSTEQTFNPPGEPEIELPFKWEICPTCRGEGVSSAYLGAFTREDMEREGPEFMEDYIDGKYDRACGCNNGKVRVVDEARCTTPELKEALREHYNFQRELAEDRRTQLYENGGYE